MEIGFNAFDSFLQVEMFVVEEIDGTIKFFIDGFKIFIGLLF